MWWKLGLSSSGSVPLINDTRLLRAAAGAGSANITKEHVLINCGPSPSKGVKTKLRESSKIYGKGPYKGLVENAYDHFHTYYATMLYTIQAILYI